MHWKHQTCSGSYDLPGFGTFLAFSFHCFLYIIVYMCTKYPAINNKGHVLYVNIMQRHEMVTKTSTIQLVQKNNEVMQLQNYSFRNELFWPSAESSELNRSTRNECKGFREKMIKRNLGKIVRHANTASCTARPRWEILSTSTATAAAEKFYFSRCGVCLRSCLMAQN